jgi:exoribonuclease R
MASADAVDLLDVARRVMAENGFAAEFPPEAVREAEEQPDGSPPPESGVQDLRALPWSSIDNRDSRDLDQAEVVESLSRDVLRVRIAIADVHARVLAGTAVDGHASANTTSVYTGVAVFPMLPERLSNDLTSLNPGEDRLAVVVDLDVAPTGRVLREGMLRALVRNHAKLDYESVGLWLEGHGPMPALTAGRPDLAEQVQLQDEAARRLIALRRGEGLLDLDVLEPRAVVAQGKVVDLQLVPQNRARDIIESFMVAANGALARFLSAAGRSAIRRVVRQPKRWDRIVALAAEFGDALPLEPDRRALAAFLMRRRTLDPEHFPDLSLAVVKMLGSGEYVLERRLESRADTGHFSLGAVAYAHGTAPNRRYGDLVLQRLVAAALADQAAPYEDDALGQIAERCTLMERAARKVERTVRKTAAAVLMADRIGESFVAVVTGVSDKGTYVRVLRPPVEGRVVRGHEGLDVGDTARVTLIGVDARLGHVDFEGPHGDVRRKLERSRQKRQMAARLASRVGRTFNAVVVAASPKGVYVHLPREFADGRVVRGQHGLVPGQKVEVVLVSADSAHGFIDFEYPPGIEPRKLERQKRKQQAALALRDRVGATFDAVVTGVSPRATWIRLRDPEAEGRLVRGRKGLAVGEPVRAVLLAADPVRGYIDFARA